MKNMAKKDIVHLKIIRSDSGAAAKVLGASTSAEDLTDRENKCYVVMICTRVTSST